MPNRLTGTAERSPGSRRLDAVKTSTAEIGLVGEHVDHPYRLGIRYVIVETLWKKDALRTSNFTHHKAP